MGVLSFLNKSRLYTYINIKLTLHFEKIIAFNSSDDDSLEINLGRTTVGSISHGYHLDSFELGFVSPVPKVKRHGIVTFWNYVFLKFFFSNTIFAHRFSIPFSTNLHPISFQ
jgi:hypothetical protein